MNKNQGILFDSELFKGYWISEPLMILVDTYKKIPISNEAIYIVRDPRADIVTYFVNADKISQGLGITKQNLIDANINGTLKVLNKKLEANKFGKESMAIQFSIGDNIKNVWVLD